MSSIISIHLHCLLLRSPLVQKQIRVKVMFTSIPETECTVKGRKLSH